MPKIRIVPFPRTIRILEQLKTLATEGILSQEEVTGSIQTLCELSLEMVKKATPGSGKLRGLWALQRNERARFIEFIIFNKAEKSLPKDAQGRTLLDYLEFGTTPHTIYAKNARALRFILNSSPVFAKFVRHPGTKPYGMLKAGQDFIERNAQELFNTIRQKMRKKFDELGK